MNMTGKRTNSRGRRSKRGVSPIIATILLVAITVVLAAVLYVLISGLTSGGGSTPYSVQMSNPTPTTPVAGTFWVALSLNPTSGLTTALFGLKITDLNGNVVPGAVASPVGCTVGATFTAVHCPAQVAASTVWYAVVVTAGGNVANLWTNGAWIGGTTVVNGANTMYVVTGASIDAINDQISAFSTGTSSVSGSSPL